MDVKLVGYTHKSSGLFRIGRFWITCNCRHAVRWYGLRSDRFSIGTILYLFLFHPFIKVIFVERGVAATTATPSWATAAAHIGTKGVCMKATICRRHLVKRSELTNYTTTCKTRVDEETFERTLSAQIRVRMHE